ncbi:MAG TPA: alcohol dehydrogenase catalytic domain-containing protein [Candidatus Binatia bacterium]|nr:alcohol dehydrogenase catalytic domain-containing protein [Candidatus Binatia bacterium]
MQGTMKAARLHGFERTHGSREVVRVDEVTIPEITTGEVLVRVLRAGLNHGDLHMREDAVQYSPEVKTVPDLPMTIGHDGLGEVVDVGPDVENVRVGDRVVVICSITCGFCKYCRTERQHLCQTKKTMGFLTKWGEGPAYLRRYKDGLWAEYCRVPAGNVVSLPRDTDVNEMCKVSQINVGYRALKRARLHSGEIVLVNGASGITGIGTVLSALAMGAAQVIAVARNPARLERVASIDPKRIVMIALGRGESITKKVKELTEGQGASVLADLAPGGIETTIECIRNLEPGGRVALIAPNPEPLNLPLRYLMIRSIEFTSVTGRFAMDVAELLQLVQRGVIDTRHITTRYFPLAAVNEALDYIETRGDNDPLWPMYAAD